MEFPVVLTNHPFVNVDVRYDPLGSECPLSQQQLHELYVEIGTPPDKLFARPVEVYGGDWIIREHDSYSFRVNSDKRLVVQYQGIDRVITRVSALPGTDRVIRPSDRISISTHQRRFVRKLTEFISGKRVYATGPFRSVSELSGATADNYDIRIRGDRPFPVNSEVLEGNTMGDLLMTLPIKVRKHDNSIFVLSPSGSIDVSSFWDQTVYLGGDVGEGGDCVECRGPGHRKRTRQVAFTTDDLPTVEMDADCTSNKDVLESLKANRNVETAMMCEWEHWESE